MSGFEVAGIVLAVVPIITEALKSANKGLVVFKAKRHVSKLIHELEEQQACLALTLKALFVRSGVTHLPDDWEKLPQLLNKRADVREAVEDFLEPKVLEIYEKALEGCRTSVSQIARRIGGLCGGDQKQGAGSLEAVLQAQSGGVRISRIKLLLRKEEIDEAISGLKDAVRGLGNLQKLVEAGKSTLVEAGLPPSNSARQLAKRLSQARRSANWLYFAIVASWSPTCIQRHSTKLFLEARIDPKPARRESGEHGKKRLKHEAVIACVVGSVHDQSWHESHIELLDDDALSLLMSGATLNTTPSTGPAVPTVKFTNHGQPQVKLSDLKDVADLCELVKQTLLRQQTTKLYLLENAKLQFTVSQNSCVMTTASNESTTLAKLLEHGVSGAKRSTRIPLRDRMLLALALSSNVVQLQETPWLNEAWSKDKIHFPRKEKIPPNSSAGSASCFDTRRPFILREFGSSVAHNGIVVPPRRALQGFGIVLLELWHDVQLETHFGLRNPPSFGEQLPLALDWMDDVDDPPPDPYRQVISQCLQPHFTSVSGKLEWDDLQFRQAVCQFIVTPLSRNCIQWSGS